MGLTQINNKKTIEYSVSIQIDFCPFKLQRKAERYNPTFKKYLTRYIQSVELIGKEDAQCIYVDSPEHTYATGKHYVVTHNTTSLSVASIEGNFDSILIICPASLKTNWRDELLWYVPERDITIVDSAQGKTKAELEKMLLLVSVVPQNIFNIINEKNKLVYFNDEYELLRYFTKWRSNPKQRAGKQTDYKSCICR